jgi:hypothetical protein
VTIHQTIKDDDPWRISWAGMNALAWRYLNSSVHLDPPLFGLASPLIRDHRLRLWDDAKGFGSHLEPLTLTVLVPLRPEEGEPVVRRATWRRRLDLGLLHKLVQRTRKVEIYRPTIDVHDASVPSARLEELLDEGTRLRLPVVIETTSRASVLDVGSVGVECFSGVSPPAVLRLEWSVFPPANWGPVIEWAGRVRGFLEACLTAKGDPTPARPEGAHPLWDPDIDVGSN